MSSDYPPPVFEVPDGKVRRKATFYPMMGTVLDHHLVYERLEKTEYFPPSGHEDPSWCRTNEDRFRPMEMPPEIGAHWEHKYLALDVEDLKPFTASLRVTNDEMIPHIPDIGAWVPFQIVSERAKTVLEEIDEAGSYFLPLRIFSQGDQEIDAVFWWWVARHRIFYEDPGNKFPSLGFPFPGPFTNSRFAHEITHRCEVRDYLNEIPFWGSDMPFPLACFRADVFERLRAERLTGLVENTEERFRADRKIHESIGHID